jgi:hypothetical protein
MKRFLVYSSVVVALVALTGPAAAQYSTGTTNTTNTTDQNMTTPSNSTPTTTQPSTETQSTTDQSTTTSTSTTTDNKMPRTASPLPLIAMSGMLTLIAGMWISRRRRSA